MTDDHEFYHDIGGALTIKENNAIQWKKIYTKNHAVVDKTL
ncbi:MAG: hypothetical protein ACI8RP_000626 [Urechidicola sp.]|jgi:hypothetical protein